VADEQRPVATVAGPRILLVRHAATRLNAAKGTVKDVVRGQSNPPLDDQGRQEARQMCQRLKDSGIRELYASPLTRTVYTGKAIGEPYHLSPRPARELLPWDMGALQGVQATLAKPALRQYAEQHPTVRIPRGESFLAWERRFIPWMQKLMHHVEQRKLTAACVTHSRCIKLLEGWLAAGQKGLHVDFDVMFRENTEPGEVYELRPSTGGRWEIHEADAGYVLKNGRQV
jgi:broad specificity phosphatase PhoE